MYAAVGTASLQHGLGASTVCVWQVWRYVAKGYTGAKVDGWLFFAPTYKICVLLHHILRHEIGGFVEIRDLFI